jgi:multiple sugar transport system substrate-binding protein
MFLIGTLLTGCGAEPTPASATPSQSASDSATPAPEASQPSGSGEPVKLNVNIQTSELSEEQIAEFETLNPGIKVEVVVALQDALMARIAAGNAPDIIRINGAQDIPTFVSRGLALDLDPYFAKSEKISVDDMLPVCDIYRYDGKTQGQGPRYGLPKDWSPDQTIWYNKRVFDMMGVPVPSGDKPLTYTELLELAKKVTKIENGQTAILGLAIPEYMDIPKLMAPVQQLGSSLFSPDFKSANLTSPEAMKIFQWYLDATKAMVLESPINSVGDWGGNLFLDDKAAMIQYGYWYSGMIRGHGEASKHLEDFGMLPAPILEGGKRTSPCTGGTGLIVYSGSKHPEEAFKFIEYYLGPKDSPAISRAKGGWGVPAFKSLVDLMPKDEGFNKNIYDALKVEEANSSVMSFNPFATTAGINGVISKHFNKAITDEATLEAALKDAEAELNILIQEGMDIAGIE